MLSLLSFSKRHLAVTAITAISMLAMAPERVHADRAGPYLAARLADQSGNFEEVVRYGVRALSADPENIGLLEGIVVAHTGLRQLDDALPFARRLAALSSENQIAGLILLADAAQNERWDEVLGQRDSVVSLTPVVDELIRAWAIIGQGRMSEALAIFDKLTKDPSSRGFALSQKAMALAHVGDFESAASILGGDVERLNLNRVGVLAYAQVLSQLDRQSDAVEMIETVFGKDPPPEFAETRDRLLQGDVLEFTSIRSPKAGVAELFFAVAESLSNDAAPSVTLLYDRVAEHLLPDHMGAILLSAELLEEMEHHDLAVEAYSRIPKDSHAYPQAALGRTIVLRRAGKLEEATVELRDLADAYPDMLRFRVALGDTLMEQDRYAEARAAYDTAIDGFRAELPTQWSTYFQRAIALSKLDDWPPAEADFRQALKLSPEQPSVLNYLGYSLVERREKLDEALGMIKRAVAARPDSGFIVDSLGWGLFRLGQYDEAAVQMERAVELMPVDPILNDHLGDTYWAVGRKREAEFQWSRALSFITDDTDLTEIQPDRIRRKLEVGLDVVLDEEGAPPLHPTE